PTRRSSDLCPDIAQADVEALSGDRVEAVAGIADEGEALRGYLRGVVEAERVRRARPVDRDGPIEAVHALLDFGDESAVGERENAGGVALVHGPDQRAAVAAVGLVEHRQQREGAGRVEDFPGDA